ncbi:Dual specificity protein phosphatase 16 [Trichinella patagoniensis]|uniref:protein-tyrosine-phosphatase n=1 Tax=Trichinella patagoniensis TaxID=990121 RepID=A0A0V0ZRX3_9BILA|nr:Dual specificity protein phosphatase 16 [Trichinella patagoniensis]
MLPIQRTTTATPDRMTLDLDFEEPPKKRLDRPCGLIKSVGPDHIIRTFEHNDDSMTGGQEQNCKSNAQDVVGPSWTTLSSFSQPCLSQASNSGPTKILPFLYLGSQKDAMDEQLLKKYGINYVLNISVASPKPEFLQEENFLRIPVNDSYNDKLLPYFDQTFRFVDKVRETNANVLVHCLAGISRSPTLAIACVMRYLHMTSEEAYKYVKDKRPSISPNFNFLGQLLEFERRLKNIHPNPADLPCNKDHSLQAQVDEKIVDLPNRTDSRSKTPPKQTTAILPCSDTTFRTVKRPVSFLTGKLTAGGTDSPTTPANSPTTVAAPQLSRANLALGSLGARRKPQPTELPSPSTELSKLSFGSPAKGVRHQSQNSVANPSFFSKARLHFGRGELPSFASTRQSCDTPVRRCFRSKQSSQANKADLLCAENPMFLDDDHCSPHSQQYGSSGVPAFQNTDTVVVEKRTSASNAAAETWLFGTFSTRMRQLMRKRASWPRTVSSTVRSPQTQSKSTAVLFGKASNISTGGGVSVQLACCSADLQQPDHVLLRHSCHSDTSLSLALDHRSTTSSDCSSTLFADSKRDSRGSSSSLEIAVI